MKLFYSFLASIYIIFLFFPLIIIMSGLLILILGMIPKVIGGIVLMIAMVTAVWYIIFYMETGV